MTVFSSADFDSHEQVVFVSDPAADLRGIIAVHNTALGPAVGGCRVWCYADEPAAVSDVLRLSRGMTYKAAMANVPFGGGKSVILLRPGQRKTPALVQAMARAVDNLGGRYVTGEDVGTTTEDMRLMRGHTPHVMGLSREHGGSGDPSPMTALGTFVSIQACLRHMFGHDSLQGLRVAVQGLGNVGMALCGLLHRAGAVLIVADLDATRTAQAQASFAADVMQPAEIVGADADVFAPCALGAVLHAESIPVLQARIVAGAANNQLATEADGQRLRQAGILYAPDYIVNGGGMIQLTMERLGEPLDQVEARVRRIADTLQQVFLVADAEGEAPHRVADQMAQARIRHLAPSAQSGAA